MDLDEPLNRLELAASSATASSPMPPRTALALVREITGEQRIAALSSIARARVSRQSAVSCRREEPRHEAEAFECRYCVEDPVHFREVAAHLWLAQKRAKNLEPRASTESVHADRIPHPWQQRSDDRSLATGRVRLVPSCREEKGLVSCFLTRYPHE